MAFGRRIGKHVIVVGDGPGFFTTRALSPYMNEAAHLLEEGVAVEAIDQAMKDFGFPVGPITLLDEVGIDVGAKVQKILHHAFGARMDPPPSMAKLVADGRLGRKNAKGFYRYEAGSKSKEVDPSVYALLPSGAGRKEVAAKVIQERLFHAFLNESAYCLQEGILRKPVDGDIGAIFGLGFPPWLGGPFRAIDKLGRGHGAGDPETSPGPARSAFRSRSDSERVRRVRAEVLLNGLISGERQAGQDAEAVTRRSLTSVGRLPGMARVVSKFGAPFGKRFTRNHFELLRLAYSAYAGLKRSAPLIRDAGSQHLHPVDGGSRRLWKRPHAGGDLEEAGRRSTCAS